MTSPGGMEVGRISIRVLPDTSKFYREARKELNKIAKALKVTVNVALDGASAKAEFAKLKDQMDDSKVDLKVEADGDGVVREVRRIRQLAQKLVGTIRMTAGLNIPASIARIRKDIAVINKFVKGYNIRLPIEVVGISKWLAILTAVSGILLSIPHLIGAIGGAVSIAGGLLATLPALAAAAALGIGTLVVGMQGFFSALSNAGDAAAFEESLKNLTPSAQAAARALAEMREPLIEIRKSTQEALFKGMADDLKNIKNLLPPIKSGLEDTAGGIREMIREWIKMATAQDSVDDLGIITSNIAAAFRNARTALADFAAGLKDITVVGSSFLPGFGTAINNIASDFRDWAAAARESGDMQRWIQNAIDKTKQLGRIVADVWVGFRNIFSALRGGEDFLDIMERLSQSFRDFTGAEQTQETLKRLARVMRVVIDAGTELFGQVFKTASEVFKELEPFLMTFARTFATVVVGALKAVTPLLKSMARFLSDNREIMVPLVITVIAFVTAFKGLATAANLVLNVYRSFQTMKAASSIIGTIITDIGKLIKGMWAAASQAATAAARFIWAWTQIAASAARNAAATAAAWISAAVRSAAFTARYFAIMAAQAIANFGKMTVAAIASALRVAAAWILQMGRMVAVTLAQMATFVAVWVAQWIRVAAVALAQAARVALAWIIAMGPIGIIIAAIIALVILIVANWEEIASFLEGIWNWIKDLAVTVWTAISDFFVGIWEDIKSTTENVWNAITGFFSGIWNTIKNIAVSIGNGIRDAWNAVVDWIKGIPGRIGDAIMSQLSTLVRIGKDIINGIVQGLKNAASAVWNFIKGVCEDVWNSIKSFFGISSPSRLMAQGGEWIMQGLQIGMEKQAKSVYAATTKVSQGIYDSFGSSMAIGQSIADGILTGIPEAVKSVDDFTKATVGQVEQNLNTNLGVDNIVPIADTLAGALEGVTVEMDSRPVGKLINKNNVLQRRRG